MMRNNHEVQQGEFKKSLNFYLMALEKDDSNAVAAMGVGNIIAEHGMIEEGLEISNLLRDYLPRNPNPIVNIAHINMALANFDNALYLYKTILKNFYKGKNYTLECWIANVHFIKKDYESSIQAMKQLMYKYPEDVFVKFNFGIILHTY